MSDLSREQAIEKETAALGRELVAVRRRIHSRPELAGDEWETAALVAQLLREAGLDVTTGVGGHGVIGMLRAGADGPAVAYRADIDAVADDEVSGGSSGRRWQARDICAVMICTAIGVGTARVLAAIRDRLRGRIAFVFQPAEETLSGAQARIDDGALRQVQAQETYALHCVPLPVGTFAVMPGAGLPGHDNFDLELIGPSEVAKADQLVEAVASLSAITPPATEDDARQYLADLQRADGPLNRFVFADARTIPGPDRARHAHIHGWVKAWPDDAYDGIRDQVRHRVQRMFGTAVRHRLAFRDVRSPSMVCDPQLSDAAAYLQTIFGPGSVTVWRAMLPFNGEDFAEFLTRVPGAMVGLGVTNTAAGFNGHIHSPAFTADEQAISLGTRAMAGWLCTRLDALFHGAQS